MRICNECKSKQSRFFTWKISIVNFSLSINRMFLQFDFVSLLYEVKENQLFISENGETRRYKIHRIIN